MKTVFRHILIVLTGVLLSAYLVVTLTASSAKTDSLLCKGLRVEIKDSCRIRFVTAEEVKSCLDKEMPGYTGKKCLDLNLKSVEKILDNKGAVLKSEAFITKDGMLNVRITQREPAARFRNGSTGFYCDRNGYIFPLHSSYTAEVPLVEGELPVRISSGFKGRPENPGEAEWIDDMIDLILYIRNGEIWSGNIKQISVKKGGCLVIIPGTGQEKFIFGQPDDIERKFKSIEEYYKAVKPSKEDGYYGSVNVQYDGQIVCRR